MEITTVFFGIGAIGLLAFGIAVCLDYDWWRDKNKSQHQTTEDKKQE